MATWILLRGLMREARHWGDFPSLLAQQLRTQGESANILTPDFCGNGTRYEKLSSTTVEQMAARLRQQLLADGYRPPYRILAVSLGAMAAVAWAQQFPHEIERLVLINTSLQPFNRFYHRLRPHNYPRLLRMLLSAGSLEREQTVLALTSNLTSVEQRESLALRWQIYGAQFPIARRNILRQLLAAMRFRAASSAPAVPLLMLAAQQDRLVSVQCSRHIAAHWHCPLRVHPRAGHDLALDDASWVIRQVLQWLATQP